MVINLESPAPVFAGNEQVQALAERAFGVLRSAVACSCPTTCRSACRSRTWSGS